MRFSLYSRKCSITNIFKLTSTLTTMKYFFIYSCNKVYENNGVNYFWSVQNSFEVLDRLHDSQAASKVQGNIANFRG